MSFAARRLLLLGNTSIASSQREYRNLISYWNFNDYTIDYAGENNEVAHPLSILTTGKIGNGRSFNGSSAYHIIPNHSSLSFTNGASDLPFSWSFWINPTNLSAQRWIISKRIVSNTEYQVIINTTTGTISVYLYSGGGTTVFIAGTTGGGCSAGVFSHVAITYDGSKTFAGLKVYINGVLQTLTNISAGSYAGMVAGTSHVYVGTQSFNIGTGSVNGVLDEIGLFSVALDQATISAIYNGGSGLPYVYDQEDLNTDIYETNLHILATRDNYQFAKDGTDLKWSNDRGATWINTYNWGTQGIEFAYIFSDGTLLFGYGATLKRSVDKLGTINNVTAYLSDGITPYPIHTPAVAGRTGNYFQMFNLDPRHHDDDMLVWINYCNLPQSGAAPINVWYTTDKGATVKSAYTFGQNPNYRDDGTDDGGITGTLLGDAANPIICRHGHSVTRNPGTYDWYSTTGDAASEVHWFKHTYDPNNDTWTTIQLIDSADNTTKWKACGLNIIDGYVYWGSDATGTPVAGEKGMFKCLLENIASLSYEKITIASESYIPWQQELVHLNINPNNGNMLFTYQANDEAQFIYLYKNYGNGNAVRQIIVGGGSDAKMGKIYPPDSMGYYKINVGIVNLTFVKTLFVKV